ncbi:MAG: hypothetical protein R6X12_06910 [bacterium]
MRRSLFLFALLLLGCTGLFFRSGRDYFPLVRGSLWKYHDGRDTCYVEVAGDSLIGGRTCVVVTTDFVPGFWLKPTPEAEVRRWFRRTLLRGGTEYVLEQRYGLVYRLPLVTGSSWQDQFADTVIILGADTLHYFRRLEARVAGVEDLTLAAGRFEECYRLEFTETVRAEDSSTVNWTEWLAPGVGLVRRRTGGSEIELVEYRVGPD